MESGSVVAERFEIERIAGSGGMGSVFRAKDRLTGEPVALKLIQQQSASGVGRFLREGRALAELHHPAIVRYVAHGVTPEGDAFLAMEWLGGEDLGKRLETHGLTVTEAVSVVRKVAEGLAAAHARGLVHRDIKPSNIYLVDGDLEQVKVIDFGVVYFAGNAPMTALTLPGMMLGTPGYMSPEQVRGGVQVDARADVFALGGVLYACLTGRPAFVAEHPIAVLTRVLFEDVIPPSVLRPETPTELDQLVLRMLAKDPAARPADAAAVAKELAQVKLGPPSGRAPPAAAGYALTGSEQRLLSVVLAAPSAVVKEAGAEVAIHPVVVPPELRSKVERLGARFEVLSNGTYVVVSVGTGTATDHAVSAARCALALRDSLPDTPIVVATGRSDTASPTPAGEVIDRAVALLRGSPSTHSLDTIVDPGTWGGAISDPEPVSRLLMRPIRVDDVTAGLLDARFEVSSDGMALELRRERDTLEPTRTLLGKQTPCVGRDRELAVLMGAYEEVIEEPVARAVLVTAPAGTGKSRLRHEFLLRLRARREAVDVWSGRGDPMSAGSPFAMLAQALRRAMRIREDDPIEVRCDKLASRVAHSVPASEARRVTEFLGELLGVPFPDETSLPLRAARQDPILRGDQMRRAWEDFVVAECGVQPVVIVLEDLHWGDLPTVHFVDTALRVAASRPLLVLALGRPEVLELFPSLWTERGLQHMHLGELTRKASEKLVRVVLGDEAAPESVERVITQAGGNAFYLEELIRALAEGRGRSLPETVLAMVQARLETVDAEGRRVLRAASVFGPTFWRGGVRALLGSAHGASLDGWLRDLEARELITRRPTPRFRGEDEYAFRHALVREAAYVMLTDSDRAVGHQIAAQWLVQAGETDSVVLAQHYERAGEPARAAGLYHRAAAQALEGNDFAAVITLARRGVECGAEGATCGALRLLEAEAHRWRGDFAQAERAALDALEWLADRNALRFAAIAELVTASGKLGHADRVVQTSTDLESSEPQSDAALGAYAVAVARAVAQLLFMGRYDLTEGLIARLERTVQGRGVDMTAFAGWIDEARATRAMLAGDMARCLAYMDRAGREFEATGDLRNACTEREYVGYAYLELGLYTESEEVLRDAMAVASRMGLHTVVAAAKHNLGLVLARQGRIEDGLAMEREAGVEFRAQGDDRLEGAAHNYLAQIHILAGDYAAAEREARIALEILAARPPLFAGTASLLANIAVVTGRIQEGLELARRGMAVLRELGVLEEGQARLRLSYVEALAASGDMATAREELGIARKELLERAGRISDEKARASFLENVPENARTRALARAWGL